VERLKRQPCAPKSDNDYRNNYLQAEAIIAKRMEQYNEEVQVDVKRDTDRC